MKNKSFGIFVMLSFLSILLLASPVLAHVGDDDYGHHMMMGSFCGSNAGYGMGFYGSIFMILTLIILVLIIIWLYKQIQKK